MQPPFKYNGDLELNGIAMLPEDVVSAPTGESREIEIDFTDPPVNFTVLLMRFIKPKNILNFESRHVYKKPGVSSVTIDSKFHIRMMKDTSLAATNATYRPYLFTNTETGRKGLILTATQTHYYTMSFAPVFTGKAETFLQKHNIDGNPNIKMRIVTDGNIERFGLQNTQDDVKTLLEKAFTTL
jgi:hypothetical protein